MLIGDYTLYLSYNKDKAMKNISEIKDKMSKGDLATASKMIGITPANGSKAFARADSKHHESIVNALSKVIEMREMLIQEGAH